ncbi:MAG: aminotransferase class III-fold pyridoxal phosphate-dependent enzyme [Candidatus Thorarchaeota archaeon]
MPLGDQETLKVCFEKYSDKIACVIIEGVPANNGLLIQTKEFMHEIQNLCKVNGSLFILDEVITGFRIGYKGAREYYDISPDIVTFGKIIGGGLPVGAYAGKKHIMNYISPLGNMYQAGTLSGNPLVMVAGNANFDVIESNKNFYQELEENTSYIRSELLSLFQQADNPVSIPYMASILWLVYQDQPPKNPKEISKTAIDFYSKLHSKALKTGIYLPPSAFEVWFLSIAHSKTIIDETITKLKKTLLEG